MKKYPIPTFDYCAKSSMRSLHGSIIYSGKESIIQATNEPCGKVFGKCLPSIHAEMNVIHRARHLLKKVNNPVLVVVRYNRKGELVNSYPCNLCIQLIKKFGVYKVIYSNDDGHLCECRAKDLECRHVSFAMKSLGITSW